MISAYPMYNQLRNLFYSAESILFLSLLMFFIFAKLLSMDIPPSSVM